MLSEAGGVRSDAPAQSKHPYCNGALRSMSFVFSELARAMDHPT